MYAHLKEQAAQLISELASDMAFKGVVSNIKSGKFKRDPDSKDYQDRLIYTKNLRYFLHNKALFNCILYHQDLKEKWFRTLGYSKNLNFTIYPDCWIRDLPLLDIGDNVYLGDGILLGTNRIIPDQTKIIVEPISIGANSIFDQRCAIGCGSKVGTDCRFSFEVAIATRCKVGHQVSIGSCTKISNCVTIGDSVSIGTVCQIGDFVKIEDGAKIKEHSKIPSFSKVLSNGEVVLRKSK